MFPLISRTHYKLKIMGVCIRNWRKPKNTWKNPTIFEFWNAILTMKLDVSWLKNVIFELPDPKLGGLGHLIWSSSYKVFEEKKLVTRFFELQKQGFSWDLEKSALQDDRNLEIIISRSRRWVRSSFIAHFKALVKLFRNDRRVFFSKIRPFWVF